MSDDGIELPAGIALDDPRLIAAAAPYTYDLPWPDEIAALAPGDGVQAIFREIGGGRKYSAERMWVTIEQIADGFVAGYLDNDPFDMPSIKHRDRVRIPLTHVISCTYVDGKERPVVPERRRYWDRCFVDACVVEGRSHADYLYREEPDMTREGDENPDSGWRIRGTDETIAEDERLGEKPMYIALGKVLNSDDRWLHLIDREIGCAFQWDADRDKYIELQ
ncbi:immunity protein Imm33 domain-containing protein [Parerythrobacter lacustris]|uniref:DUF2185 domain-containing protein n=1 Tax=Parerythrobacter lacustris TaxID=2969984 RepID=A0ABT1XQD9_9SPHN|nr:DUF2185 domain-containing protein [Parerythrobacter lacustris]MCR2833883.1 DUF2185 domain-containing protein [Parerythrobacter lacustris]